MSSLSPSGEKHDYHSVEIHDSSVCPGVRYTVRRISARRRLDLVRSIRGLVQQSEYHEAGTAALDKLESAILSREISKVYFASGFESVEGLKIDGQTPDAESMWAHGPEMLIDEITQRIRDCWHLNDQARKNC